MTNKFHGISWKDGYITLNELRQSLYQISNNNNVQIFVKGEDKIHWLKQIMGNDELNCRNVENDSFDVLPEERGKCITDPNKIHCALENVKVLKKWFMRHKKNNKIDQICIN